MSEPNPTTPPAPAPLVWGKLLDRWHDEGPVFHALRDNGSPACGVRYFTSAGEYPYGPTSEGECCRRCLKVKGAPPLQRATPLPPGVTS